MADDYPNRVARGLWTRMAKPADRRGRLVNLGRHLLLLAQPDCSGYSPTPPHSERPPAAQKKLHAAHYRGLAKILEILAPNENKAALDTPRNRALALRILWETWQSVVVGDEGTKEQIRVAVQTGEELIARVPVAAACYTNECVNPTVMPASEALVLLSAALAHVACEVDRVALQGALEGATQRATFELSSASVPMAPVKRPAPTTSNDTGAVIRREVIMSRSQCRAFEHVCHVADLFYDKAARLGPLDKLTNCRHAQDCLRFISLIRIPLVSD